MSSFTVYAPCFNYFICVQEILFTVSVYYSLQPGPWTTHQAWCKAAPPSHACQQSSAGWQAQICGQPLPVAAVQTPPVTTHIEVKQDILHLIINLPTYLQGHQFHTGGPTQSTTYSHSCSSWLLMERQVLRTTVLHPRSLGMGHLATKEAVGTC